MQRAQAVEYLFTTLRARCPQVLADLRDTRGGDVTVATEWASRHALNCPSVIDYACFLRGQWARSPRIAKRLGGGRIAGVGSYRPASEAEKAWVAAQSHPGSQPHPDTETLSEWLRRATAQYRQLESIIYPNGRPRQPPTSRNELSRHCDWFVRVHVEGIRPAVLSRQVQCDRAAIERETKKVATLLGLQRRTWPRGRRSQCEFHRHAVSHISIAGRRPHTSF